MPRIFHSDMLSAMDALPSQLKPRSAPLVSILEFVMQVHRAVSRHGARSQRHTRSKNTHTSACFVNWIATPYLDMVFVSRHVFRYSIPLTHVGHAGAKFSMQSSCRKSSPALGEDARRMSEGTSHYFELVCARKHESVFPVYELAPGSIFWASKPGASDHAFCIITCECLVGPNTLAW
jgi:hypothetical protein